MVSQEKKEQKVFNEFLNKPIKVVYDDFGKPQIARGVLKKVDPDFIYVKGNFSEQVIAISKILKINSIRDKDGY